MIDLLYKLLPMVFLLILSQAIYLKFDEKYKFTDIINSKIKVQQKWKQFICILFLAISLLFIAAIGIYVIEIPTIVYSMLCGVLTGTSIGISNKIKIKNNL